MPPTASIFCDILLAFITLAGKLLAKTRMGKFFSWRVEDGRLTWTMDEEAVAAEQALDGCYVIKTTVSAEAMGKDEVVARYKGLAVVEQAFRNMKTVSLEMRPVHHKKDERIRAHVFLCMLAYYIQWHFRRRLAPLFAELDEAIAGGAMEGKQRTWTISSVLECLKGLRCNEVSVGGVVFRQISEPTGDQKMLLDMLGVKLPKRM